MIKHDDRVGFSTNQWRIISNSIFTCGFSPGLRTQLEQRENSDYLLFPHQVYQPKSVEAKLSVFQPLVLYNGKILTIYFFHIRYINLKVWRQNYQNFPSKARYINLKVWRQNYENFPSKARYINLKVWRQNNGNFPSKAR